MRKKGVFVLLGFLFVFFQKAEWDLAQKGNIIWDVEYWFQILLISLVAGVLLGCIVSFLVQHISQWINVKERKKKVSLVEKGILPKRAFVGVFLLIVLCWIPCYLAYYPAICSYDIWIQTGQIVEHSYNDHHPIAHTLLIEAAMRAGNAVFGDSNTGIGIYAFLQILFLAGNFAYGSFLLNRLGGVPSRKFWSCYMS